VGASEPRVEAHARPLNVAVDQQRPAGSSRAAAVLQALSTAAAGVVTAPAAKRDRGDGNANGSGRSVTVVQPAHHTPTSGGITLMDAAAGEPGRQRAEPAAAPSPLLPTQPVAAATRNSDAAVDPGVDTGPRETVAGDEGEAACDAPLDAGDCLLQQVLEWSTHETTSITPYAINGRAR
jgi:hypothetical protein